MPLSVPRSPVRFEWRCRACRLLLGVASEGALHIKYKDVEHRVRGACEHQCRRCRTANAIIVGPDACRAE
jgi:hypothetical protein